MRFTLLVALSSIACAGESASLRIDLLTDYAPGNEFDQVVVVLEREGETLAMNELPIAADVDVLSGAQVAFFEELKPELYRARVSLMFEGNLRITQDVVVDHPGGRFALTVLITRDCEGVRCPDATPELTQCVGGACVDPRCTPTTPEYCPAPECTIDTECVPSLTCARATCSDGVCLESLDDESCLNEGDVCRRTFGCVPADGGDCASSLQCELFEPTCLAGLGRRCALMGIDGIIEPRVHAVIYDPDTGQSCTELTTTAFPGTVSGAPQLFRGRIIYASGSVDDCGLWSFSLDTGIGAREPSPCGLPTRLDADTLAWVEGDGLGNGRVHISGEADRAFSLPMNWGRLWALGPGEAALDQDGPWQVLQITDATIDEVLVEPETAAGMWRNPGGGMLWVVGRQNMLEVVHTDASGTENTRVPIGGLPELDGGFSSYVGVGCAF